MTNQTTRRMFSAPRINRFPASSLFALLLGVTALSSCDDRDIVFRETKSTDVAGWTYSDSLVFAFPVSDTNRIYDIYLGIAHDKSYAFQNIYLLLHTIFPSGKRLDQRLNFDLSEPSGKWLGDCNRKSCSLEMPIQQGAYFNETGTHRIVIEQYLRRDSLAGIRELTLLLADTGKKRNGE